MHHAYRAILLALAALFVLCGVSVLSSPFEMPASASESETSATINGQAATPVTNCYGTIPIQWALSSEESNYVDNYQTQGWGVVYDIENMKRDDDAYAVLQETGGSWGDIHYQTTWSDGDGVPQYGFRLNDPWTCDNQGTYGWHYSEGDNYVGGGGSTRLDGPLFPWEAARSGNLYSPMYDFSGCMSVTFSCCLKDDNLDTTDLKVHFLDNDGVWRYQFNVGDCQVVGGNWRYKEMSVSSSVFMHSDFRVKYEANNVGWTQVVCLDGHRIMGYTRHSFDASFSFNGPIPYELYETIELRVTVDPSTPHHPSSPWGWPEPAQVVLWGARAGWMDPGESLECDITDLMRASYRGGDLLVNLRYPNPDMFDTSADSVYIQRMYLYMYNDGPGNTRRPTSDSLYETRYLLADKSPHPDGFAYITTYHSHSEGYENIAECRLAGYYSESALWEVLWNTSGFSIVSGQQCVVIENGTASGLGEYLNITWHVKILWEHPHIDDIAVRVTTKDTAASDTDTYDVHWGVKTRLDLVGFDFYDEEGADARGNVNGSITVIALLRFDGTSEAPRSWSVSFWVCANLSSGWSNHSKTCDWAGVAYTGTHADSLVGETYYWFKATPCGANVSYPSLFGVDVPVSYYTTYISDRIHVEPFEFDDHVNVGVDVTVSVQLMYEYDGSYVTDGDVVLGGSQALYQGEGVWSVTDALGDVGAITYSIICENNTWSVSAVSQSSLGKVVWDRVIVLNMSTSDERVSTGASTMISCRLAYEYNMESFHGLVRICGIYGTYSLDLDRWSVSYSESLVGQYELGDVEIVHNALGISVVNQNNQSVVVIWDAVEICDFGCDKWTLVNTSYYAWCMARLLYDDTPLGAEDIIVIAGQQATWNGTHFVSELSCERAGIWLTVYLNSTLETTYGISTMYNHPDALVLIADVPMVEDTGTTFVPRNGLYQGVFSGPPLWIRWDPLNDPTPPSFTFDIRSACRASWYVTSSWSVSVVAMGEVCGTPLLTEVSVALEGGMDYDVENYTYLITVENEVGLRTECTVYVLVRDYTPPLIIGLSDMSYELGSTGNLLRWNLSDLFPALYRVRCDGVAGNWMPWSNGPIEFNIDGLSLDDHSITIEAQDSNGNTVSQETLVQVIDTTRPTVSHPDDMTIREEQAGYNMTWVGNDLMPSVFRVYLNDTLVRYGAWDSPAQELVVVLVDMEPGLYIYRLVLLDSSMNWMEDVVEVTVIPAVTSPIDTMAIVILSAAGVVAVTVIFVAIHTLKPRRPSA